MLNEQIFTVEEVAKYLRVPVEAVRSEIANGRLRVTHIADHIRVRESELYSFMSSSRDSKQQIKNLVVSQAPLVLDNAPDFSHTWPNKIIEDFSSVKEGVVAEEGTNYHIKIGFTIRTSAGKKRRRSLVLINRYPSVEFVSADASGAGLMASIIRDRNGKQLPIGAVVPQEYSELRIGGYREIVAGPGAPNGLAVICDPADIQSMARHGLIRYRYREARNQKS